jgi:hypothetical protein
MALPKIPMAKYFYLNAFVKDKRNYPTSLSSQDKQLGFKKNNILIFFV